MSAGGAPPAPSQEQPAEEGPVDLADYQLSSLPPDTPQTEYGAQASYGTEYGAQVNGAQDSTAQNSWQGESNALYCFYSAICHTQCEAIICSLPAMTLYLSSSCSQFVELVIYLSVCQFYSMHFSVDTVVILSCDTRYFLNKRGQL